MLVATLLLCHGIFGYEHQLAGDPGPRSEHTVQAGPMNAHHTPSDNEGTTGHHAIAAVDYFAVLVLLFFGATLWSRRRTFLMPAVHAAPRITQRFVTPLVVHPPRGPTHYLFQVILR